MIEYHCLGCKKKFLAGNIAIVKANGLVCKECSEKHAKFYRYDDFMDFVESMTLDYTICEKCGGTGFEPVMCCDNFDCGCQGGAVDYSEACSKCGRKGDVSSLLQKSSAKIS